MNWPAKDPDETLNYSLDWSRYLDGESISSVQWYIHDENNVKITATPVAEVNNITALAQSNTSTVATVQLSGGSLGTTYKIVCAVTFGGLVAERTVRLAIKEK